MIIVFSGYNQRAVIAFLRTLENNKLRYSIIACGEQDTIFKTSYRKAVVYIRKQTVICLDDIMNGIKACKSDNIDEHFFLTPSSEALNRFLLENRKVFEKERCIIPLVDKELYCAISDKESFSKLCKKMGITVPREVDISDGYRFPIVAKPKKYLSSDLKVFTPEFLTNRGAFSDFVNSHRIEDFSYQELLPPTSSYYLLFYFGKNNGTFILSQENYAQQFGGKHIIMAETSNIHLNPNVVQPYVSMLNEIGFYGLIMIELRYHDGQYYMIEANPRLWGPSQLFCDANENLFKYMLIDYGMLQSEKETTNNNKNAMYYWSGGINKLGEKECVWYGNGWSIMKEKRNIIEDSDIYRREDTMDIYYTEKLTNLYQEASKHSNYQILADDLERYVCKENITILSRYESERMNYILSHIDLKGKKIIDIGGNTGYFTFQSIKAGAESVVYYEGNKTHAEFVTVATEALGLKDKVIIHDEYYLFDKEKEDADICFCLNVIHHLGDDFDKVNGKENAKEKMIDCINQLARCAKILVLQLGYNWKGNRDLPLLKNGTKQEMIEFIQEETKYAWDIVSIGIAEGEKNNIKYFELNENNVERKNELGEFLNRPIIILKKHMRDNN